MNSNSDTTARINQVKNPSSYNSRNNDSSVRIDTSDTDSLSESSSASQTNIPAILQPNSVFKNARPFNLSFTKNESNEKFDNFNEIYLIAEDRINPCINRLLQLYPKIKFKIQSLEEDIKLILGSKNVVMGFGTFIPSLLLVSDNIKELYKPSYMNNDETDMLNKMIKVFNIELSTYKKRMTPWKNTLEQRKFMLTYK
jgi:hypothetical protein